MAEGTLTATRIVFLELKDERRMVREGYELLDEKRILLAAEILRALRRHRVLRGEWLTTLRAARVRLADATARHGLDALQVYPEGVVPDEHLDLTRHGLLGLTLVEASLEGGEPYPSWPPVEPSPESGDAARAFRDLLRQAAVIAALECTLRRMAREYVRTERRARAIENVLLPEIDADLRYVDSQLEATDQEEAIRVRQARG
jgi:V/A-type H+-transporting ATPase subunit D